MKKQDKDHLLRYLAQMTTSWDKRLIELRGEIKNMEETLSVIAKLLEK